MLLVATDNKQQTTNNKQQTTDNKQRTTNNGQQITNNKQQTTNSLTFIIHNVQTLAPRVKAVTRCDSEKTPCPWNSGIGGFSSTLMI